MNKNSQSNSGNGISRRKVVAGAVWAAPAVVVATAAPSVAASQGLVQLDGDKSCKGPGSNNVYSYYITVCVTNPSATQTLTGTITYVVPGNVQPINPTVVGPLAPGEKGCYSFYTFSTNSSNFDASATLTYFLDGTGPLTSPSTLTIGNFNPCCTGNAICPDGCTVNTCPPVPA